MIGRTLGHYQIADSVNVVYMGALIAYAGEWARGIALVEQLVDGLRRAGLDAA